MSRRNHRISIAQLRQCAEAGMSKRAAAKALGCTPAGVRYVADKYDIAWTDGRSGRPRKAEAVAPVPIDPIERMRYFAAQENARLRAVCAS